MINRGDNMKRSHGHHILVDYTNFFTEVENIGNLILSLMEQAVDNSNARRVHSHVEIFDGIISPPGFAAVVLLDESHLSAHCYSEKGWLAIDCFTCGGTDAKSIVDEIHQHLILLSPGITLEKQFSANRFLHGGE